MLLQWAEQTDIENVAATPLPCSRKAVSQSVSFARHEQNRLLYIAGTETTATPQRFNSSMIFSHA